MAITIINSTIPVTKEEAKNLYPDYHIVMKVVSLDSTVGEVVAISENEDELLSEYLGAVKETSLSMFRGKNIPKEVIRIED